MRISLWTYDALDAFAKALEADPRADLHIDRCDQIRCRKLLDDGRTDAALVSSFDVLREPERFRVVPGLGLASLGGFPNLRLRLHGGLDRIETIAVDGTDWQAAEMANLLVREHYGQRGRLISETDKGADSEKQDATLECKDSPLPVQNEKDILDLGTEWYELTTRPMVWGMLVSKDNVLPAGFYEFLVDAASAASWKVLEGVKGVWQGKGEVFTQLDEFALQGLEKFAQYMFWTNRVDQLPNLKFAQIPELKAK